jgi:hypothetical protein
MLMDYDVYLRGSRLRSSQSGTRENVGDSSMGFWPASPMNDCIGGSGLSISSEEISSLQESSSILSLHGSSLAR